MVLRRRPVLLKGKSEKACRKVRFGQHWIQVHSIAGSPLGLRSRLRRGDVSIKSKDREGVSHACMSQSIVGVHLDRFPEMVQTEPERTPSALLPEVQTFQI